MCTISDEKYYELWAALRYGANLPPCNLQQMAEYEKVNGLREVKGDAETISTKSVSEIL